MTDKIVLAIAQKKIAGNWFRNILSRIVLVISPCLKLGLGVTWQFLDLHKVLILESEDIALEGNIAI
jgi:hypothetical protein